jgi:hypothetical protein
MTLVFSACDGTGSDNTGLSIDDAIYLSLNRWSKICTLEEGGKNYFSFYAEGGKDYFIRVNFKTLTDVQVRVVDRNEHPINGSSLVRIKKSDTYWYTSVTVPSYGVYYIQVNPFSTSNSGTYQMGYNTNADFAPY